MALLDDVVQDALNTEGVKLKVYDDATGLPIVKGTLVKGHPTIGTGRALDVHGISNLENSILLNNDATTIIGNAKSILPWFSSLDEIRQRVVINMIFNLGFNGFMEFHNLIVSIEAGHYGDAADAILNSGAARELPKRYLWLSKLMRGGVYMTIEAANA